MLSLQVDSVARTCDVHWYSYEYLATGNGDAGLTEERGLSVYSVQNIHDERFISTTDTGMWIGPAQGDHSADAPRGGLCGSARHAK